MKLLNKIKKIFTFKSALLLTGVMFLVVAAYYGVKDQAAKPELCITCHMMNPQYYTWQASSHDKAPCIACHEVPGITATAKSLFYTVTNTYVAPIKTIKPIPDRKCESCHNLPSRSVTPSGDLIIPHSVHKDKGIACAKCHKGVAHGHISERQVTYKSDYDKWDLTLAKTMMTDDKTRPLMETCMRCHEVRKAPLDCKACHRTSMLPEEHKVKKYREGNHGLDAARDLQTCDKCHSYMSSQKYEGFKEISKFNQYLQTQKPSNPSPIVVSPQAAAYFETQKYAKVNTFCGECHGKRPPSHDASFAADHEQTAKISKDRCMTCHDSQENPASPVKVACASCHPSSHYKNWQWKQYHPVEFQGKPKVVKSCFECHSSSCTACHKGIFD